MNSLPSDFDTCIIGRTVGPYNDHLVYSLSGLLKLHDGDRDAVALLMKSAFTEHGSDAPVFVDDSLNDGGGKPAPLVPDEPTPPVPVIITDNNPKVVLPFPGTRMPALGLN